MEKLQNLLKLKEAEIEKLGSLRNALKRKVVELNDRISLKDVKISSLKEDLQQKSAELETAKKSLQAKNQQMGYSKQNLPNQAPISSPSIEKKIDTILSTLLQMEKNFVPSASPSHVKLHETPKLNVPKSPTSATNHRNRLKPITSKTSEPQISLLPPGSPNKSKSKMISPIVNVAKIQNMTTPDYGSDSYEMPSTPSPPTPPGAPPKPPIQSVKPQTLPSPSTPKVNGAEPQVEMGLYGVPTFPYPEDGLIKCPKCGGNKLQESENKKKIVMYNPRKYGKKWGCSDCRYMWDFSY
ncbi:MAG: hypothetical protein ACTSYU_01825 [Promethearchaeota archaeon]